MDDIPTTRHCLDCGGTPADARLGDHGPLCDACFDRHVSAATGLPALPPPPGPVALAGADGRTVRMHHRIRRVPTGIALELREDGAAPDEGYVFKVLGNHDADVLTLADALRRQAEVEVGRHWLEPAPHRDGWQPTGTEVTGRLIYDPDHGPYRVVIDGRSLSWAELGEALELFEGWRFRLVIEDPATDLRSDAEIVDLPDHRIDGG